MNLSIKRRDRDERGHHGFDRKLIWYHIICILLINLPNKFIQNVDHEYLV